MSHKFRCFGEKMDQIVEQNLDKKFLLFQNKSYTYEKMNQKVNQLANGFYEIGIRKGDKVSLLIPNNEYFIFTLFALLKIGAVTVPININQRGQGLSYIINQCDAEVIIYIEEFHEKLIEINEELMNIKKIITFGINKEVIKDWKKDCYKAETFLNTAPTRLIFKYPEINPEDPCEIIYTSGTTGAPKGAIWSYKKIDGNIGPSINFQSKDVFYTCLPLFHGLAQTMLFMCLYSNATFVLSPKFSASNFWKDINHYQATWFNHIGGIIPILLKQPEKENDVSNTAIFSYGCGAPQDPAVWKYFEKRFGIQIVEYYGTTEAGAVTVGSKPGSIGKVKESHWMKVIDEKDQECEINKIGEIISKTKDPEMFFQGYYNMPEATAEETKGGWVRNGDLAYRDEEGYYYFVGRKKESIRRRGENISPWEIENVVNSHPFIKESAAIAVPSDIGEDDVKICIVLYSEAFLSYEELIEFCQERMAYYLIPRYVEFKESLPKTSTEKVERLKLKIEGITSNTWDREKSSIKLKR